jgi:hypothetical protein
MANYSGKIDIFRRELSGAVKVTTKGGFGKG